MEKSRHFSFKSAKYLNRLKEWDVSPIPENSLTQLELRPGKEVAELRKKCSSGLAF
jgi:hypothetical protein